MVWTSFYNHDCFNDMNQISIEMLQDLKVKAKLSLPNLYKLNFQMSYKDYKTGKSACVCTLLLLLFIHKKGRHLLMSVYETAPDSFLNLIDILPDFTQYTVSYYFLEWQIKYCQYQIKFRGNLIIFKILITKEIIKGTT